MSPREVAKNPLARALVTFGVMADDNGMPARPPGADRLPYDIIEFYPDATLVIDSDGRVIAWNKAIEDMTGVPASEMLGKGDYEYALAFYGCRRPLLINLLDVPLDRVRAQYSEVRVNNGKLEAMAERVRLRGSDVVLWGVSSKLYGPGGETVGAIESIRDVTWQVNVEKELNKAREELERRVEERTAELARARSVLQATLEAIPVGVIMADAKDGRISFATKSAANIFGDRIIGIDICGDTRSYQLLKPDGTPLPLEDRPLYRSMFNGEHISAEEVLVERADGTSVATLQSSLPVRDEEGRILSVVVCVMDITEHKRAIDALRESEAKFRVLADTLASGVFIYQDDRLLYVNRALEQITGYSRDELLAMGYWGFMHPDDCEMIRQRGKDRLSGARVPSRYETRILTKNGEERWLDIAAALIEYDHRPAGLMTAFDITERKIAEVALLDAKAQAELYLDLMGHDINNLNQIAMGYLEMAEGTGDARTVAVVAKALEMLRGSSALIGNLRKIQRFRGGAVRLERTDLGQLLAEVREEYRSMPGREIAIAYRPVSGCEVMANPLLKDVFSNLVGNAIKHSSGSLHVTIGVERVKENGRDCLRVSVEDNGPGIRDEDKEKVFNRLARGTTAARGHGLGLYLVRTLVEGFRGRVWVEDRIAGDHSKGCRVVVLLPAAPAGPQ